MQLVVRASRSRLSFERIMRVALAVALVLSMTTFEISHPEVLSAAPALSVSTSVSKSLLGGVAHVSVTVTNNGTTKGYNPSIDTTSSSSIAPLGLSSLKDASVAPTVQRTAGATTRPPSGIWSTLPHGVLHAHL